MTASTFDTLAAADRLRDAGFDDAQSRAIVGIHRDAGETLVTKTDLALWSQGVGIVGGFIAIAAALRLFP